MHAYGRDHFHNFNGYEVFLPLSALLVHRCAAASAAILLLRRRRLRLLLRRRRQPPIDMAPTKSLQNGVHSSS